MRSFLSEQSKGENIEDLNIYFTKSYHEMYVKLFCKENLDYDS